MTYAVWKVVYAPVTERMGYGAQRTQHLLTPPEFTYEDVCQSVKKYTAKQHRENDVEYFYVGANIISVEFYSLVDFLER